ncbi:ABC transporter permease [Niallia circulans]|jgi:dipeptide transport system permease protein|uniref:Peptide ABC transporter permease n=1 Tax=Niallia circulans TaxID=1397 RepID=A0A0J1I988_NIACI|nr:ABC transporter permease [Niallia circulans]KLV22507.1 peptide ABC transporter permease [Niallia circulans]MCM2983182.1 ABC transporter permease [Niallia circulans]MDR4318342.1 ABC transporter permease [Niallia circulans]MED3840421.1 ABC transporter permease [Niallia circulans]MED4243244.1 ABC transporter permease [Niallia circulans]
MKSYYVKRFFSMLVTLWVIITITFFLMHFTPGSPFNDERTTNDAIQKNLEEQYHLDKPLIVQYGMYLKQIATFDFGISIKKSSQTVNEMIGRGFPVSFELGMVSLIVAVISGITLGVIASLKHNGVIDYAAMTIAVIGISIPNFVLATMLIQQFAVNWRILPTATWSSWKHMILPTIALATGPTAIIARLTRTSMLEVLTQDYIKTAKAKGLSPFKIIVKHALRNALLPVVTLLGALAASILTGTFVIEKIFAIPGMGKYFVDSINNRDYPVIMGTTIFYSTILIIMLFLVDLAYGILDPRIKLQKKEG